MYHISYYTSKKMVERRVLEKKKFKKEVVEIVNPAS